MRWFATRSVSFEVDAASVAGQSEPVRFRAVVLTVAAMGLFGPSLIAWSSIIQLRWVGVIATLACAATLAIVVTVAVAKTESTLDRVDWVVLTVAVLVLGAWAVTELYFYPAYGTDEAAFVQYAAQLLLHGHNPYTHSLSPALTEFRVPIQFATYKLNGGIVSNLGYPSLSFLLAAPFVWFTHGVQSIIIENALFLGAEMVLLFVFLPRAYRSLGVVVILGLPFLFDYSVGGDIVTMTIPFLMYVAFRWTEIGDGGLLGRGGVLRAVCLGLAMSISQFPWFIAPFLMVGLWHFRVHDVGRARATSVLVRFGLVAAGAFLVVNAPFILWSPGAWLSGVLSPIDQHAIPFGQGLIDASVFFGVGGGNLAFYTYAAVLAFFAILIFFGVFLHRFWRVAFILPSVVFLFSTRSLSEYFIMMVALWLVSVFAASGATFTNGLPGPIPQARDPGASRDARVDRNLLNRRIVFMGGPTLAVVVCLVLALTSASPLLIELKSVQTNGQFKSIWQIQALVRNRSHGPMWPHFATDASGYLTTFWNVTVGPRELLPGQSALYTLVAPNVGSMPGVTQPFLLQAVTASPETISSSGLFTPEPFDCSITPSYFNQLLPLGSSVVLNVELRSPYGAPVHRGGVPIALSQVVYSQNALIPGEARINGAPIGQSPVVAVSDSNGRARFVIEDSSYQGGNPLYFQANVAPQNGFPYGYSEVVSIQWTPTS